MRDIWYIFVIFSLLMPLSMVFGFARMGGGLNDRAGLLYIITGSAIFAVANEGISMLAGRVGEMKRDGLLLYYATLPISKTAFILAILLSRLVLTIPGMLVAMAGGPGSMSSRLWRVPGFWSCWCWPGLRWRRSA